MKPFSYLLDTNFSILEMTVGIFFSISLVTTNTAQRLCCAVFFVVILCFNVPLKRIA